MKSCKDFYNDSAKMWADNWYENETLLPYLKAFLSKINKSNPRILDVCCGAGYESMRLNKLGANVVGIDFSEKELEIAKEKNRDVIFYNRDVLYDYSDIGDFDGVACIAGIVHFEKEQLIRCFENIAKVLKINGQLLLVFKEGEEVKKTSFYNDEEYERNFVYHTKDEIAKAMKHQFEFEEQLPSDDEWCYVLYKRI